MIGKRKFMVAGKTNKEDRENFIKFWADYMNDVSDEEWSRQQAILIDSQIRGADHKTYLKLRKLRLLA
ncbi:MAG TPA: hypothetical protein VJK51_05385 [Candidatus Nanoarchaeia archaeon]|nr:hypothetical protein [Candidatus Nanoarchaeia archaeon]